MRPANHFEFETPDIEHKGIKTHEKTFHLVFRTYYFQLLFQKKDFNLKSCNTHILFSKGRFKAITFKMITSQKNSDSADDSSCLKKKIYFPTIRIYEKNTNEKKTFSSIIISSRGRFHQHCARLLRATFSLSKFEAFCGERQLANSAHIWRTAHKFCAQFEANLKRQYVDEIEWRFFRQTLCAGVFSLGAQSLVKSTPGKYLSLGQQT